MPMREIVNPLVFHLIKSLPFNHTYSGFGSGHDILLRSNSKFDPFRSNYITFDAAWWGTYDGVQMVSLTCLEHALLQKKTISVKTKKVIFYFAWRLEAKPLAWPQNGWNQSNERKKNCRMLLLRLFSLLHIVIMQPREQFLFVACYKYFTNKWTFSGLPCWGQRKVFLDSTQSNNTFVIGSYLIWSWVTGS